MIVITILFFFHFKISPGSVVLYRVGDHVDISRGPMMTSTGLLGRCTISSVHKISDPIGGATFYRVQGAALPAGVIINHFAYNLIEERSKKLVNFSSCDILVQTC